MQLRTKEGWPVRIDQLTGDSTASDLRYEGGVVTLRFEDGESGRRFQLRLTTDCVYSEATGEAGSVHVRLVAVADVLPVDPASGRYAVPDGFGNQMAAVREGLHLALGRRATEYPYLLQVRGYKIVLACPVRSTAEIELTPEEPVA